MTALRVTYIHQYFNTPSMSGSTRSYEMGRRLVAMGHEVNMITSWREQNGRADPFQTVEDGIRVHWLPIPYSNQLGYSQRIRQFCRFAVGAARFAAAIPADVVFASSTPLTVALPGIYGAWRRSVPMVFEVRDLWPELPIAVGALKHPVAKGLARRLERFAYDHADAIVALSSGMRDGVVARGYPPERVAIIPNGADIDEFQPDPAARTRFREQHGIPPDVVLVVYAGTFGLINGVGYLVKVAAMLQDDPRVRFLLVGEGREFEEVRALARETGCLGRNVTILGARPKAEMPAVLAAADIAVSTVIPLPALDANCANKVFDGLAAGCCVAINHGGWQADLLSASGAGFRLSMTIPEAANQLRDWIGDPQRLARAKVAARKLAEDQFARDKLARQLETVLISTRKRPENG